MVQSGQSGFRVFANLGGAVIHHHDSLVNGWAHFFYFRYRHQPCVYGALTAKNQLKVLC